MVFFSSRRRHTRLQGDWSSDVCSSDSAPGGPPFAYPQFSMDGVVDYLSHQENVEVLKRIKLGGTQPFMTDGRSVSEVVVAKIDEGKAQRLRAAAPQIGRAHV